MDEQPHVIMPMFSWCWSTRIDAQHYWRPHQHMNHEIIITDSGTYHCLVNGLPLKVPANHLLVVKPNDWHEDCCPLPVQFYCICFELSYLGCDNNLSVFCKDISPAEQIIAVDQQPFLSLAARIDAEMMVDDAVTGMVRDAMVREFFWRVVRAFPRELISPVFLQNSAAQSWVARLQQLFSVNQHRRLSVAEMAEAMEMPERTFTARCQALLQHSPARAFLRHKMDVADRMLAQSDMTLTAISETLGFANPYHFSRTFKAYIGVSPSARRCAVRQ